MDKVMAERILVEVNTKLSDPGASLDEKEFAQEWKDWIEGLYDESRKLDAHLAAIVKEKNGVSRAKIAEEIKKMIPGLLGEDCSMTRVTL